jgi:hypothetical protein
MREKLERLKQECFNELGSIDMLSKIAEDITWEINTRAKNRLGVCKHRYSMGYTYHTIGISDWVLENFSDKDIKDTIIHELLHTIEGCNNHGHKWQYYASYVNNMLGYNISRLASMSELCERNGIKYEEFKTSTYKYAIRCKKCGKTFYKNRLSKDMIRYYKAHDIRHKNCGGDEFVITDLKSGKIIVE